MSLSSTAEELRFLAHELRHNHQIDIQNRADNLFAQAKEVEEGAKVGPYCTWCGARVAEFGHDDYCPRPK